MKGKLLKKVIASVSAVTMLGSMAFVIPASADDIFTQDYESVSAIGDVWKAGTFTDGLALGTDHTKYASFNNNGQSGGRTATSAFDVDLTGKTKYVLEFDAAITAPSGYIGNSQFAITTGALPSANNSTSFANSLLFMSIPNASTTATINDVTTATVNFTAGAWQHYKLYADSEKNLATLTVTDAEGAVLTDKLVVPINAGITKITGVTFHIIRGNGSMAIDNILVRDATDSDEFGETGTETLSSIEFVTQVNRKIEQPPENEPVHIPVEVKATGIYGGDLTNAEGITYEWTTPGIEQEDGYISLTKEEGTENGTTGDKPDSSTSKAYFNVRNGVGNWFGNVVVKVTYLDEVKTISTPFAVVGGASAGTNIAPAPGYPENMNDYSDTLVGYQGTSTGETTQDLVLNNWSIYGSNGVRSMVLAQDDDGTKYLQFNSNGGGGTTVANYQFPEQANQYIVDMIVRFAGECTFGHYVKTPNNSGNDPNWTASYSGGTLNAGGSSIPGLGTGFNRIVVSADESAGTFWVKAYDLEGKLLGTLEDLPLAATATGTQKYFSFQGGWPVDLNSFRIYYPTVGSLEVTGNDGVVQIPEDETSVTKDLSAVVTDTDGNKITGPVTWSLAEEYAGITLAQDAENKQNAVLTVTNEAGPGEITVVATYGSTRKEVPVTLSASGNVMVFTKTTSSITIPFEEPAVTQVFEAEAKDKDGATIEADVKYEMVDASNQAVTATGITFDAETGTLSVAPNAVSKIVYIRASANVNDETLSARTKVNIHGLSFAFGSDAPEDETLTQVTSADAYTDRLGYGFADTSAVADEAADVKGTAAYTFKAKVPSGNYTVDITTTAASVTSEVVEGVPATTGITKTGAKFNVAVADGVLDLTFPADSTLSKLTITQLPQTAKRDKPMLYAIGDSTTNNNNNGGKSWGNWMADNPNELPDALSAFSNNGMAGRDSVNFYNQGRVEAVLLAVAPGDYVTVNMGINSRETGEAASFYTLLDEYYVNAIIQRGAIPVIVTATPQGPVNGHEGNYSGGKFNCNRGDGAHNGDLRNIAKKHGLNIIELGQYGDTYFNAIDDAFIAKYNQDNSTDYKDALSLVQSWYVDHNHYREFLGEVFARYITGEIAKLIAAPEHTVTFTGEHATVEIAGETVTSKTVKEGAALTFTVTPEIGYKVTSVKAGDTELTAVDGVYTIESVTGDTTVTITTAEDTAPVNPKVTFNAENATVKVGDMPVTGSIEVQPNGDLSFTVEPAEGYEIVSVKVGDDELTAVDGVYTISGIAEDKTVTITTKAKTAPDSYIKYEAEYTEDGVLKSVTVTPDAVPNVSDAEGNTDTHKIFYWKADMTPWVPAAPAE